MLALLLVAAVTASQGPQGSVVVVVARHTGVSDDEAMELAREVSAALGQRVGVPLSPDVVRTKLRGLKMSDATRCAGRPPCLAELGRALEVSAVVALTVSQIEGDRSVVLEAFAAADATKLARHAELILANTPKHELALKPFVEAVAGSVSPPSPVPEPGPAPPLVTGATATPDVPEPVSVWAPEPAAAPVEVARPAVARSGLRPLAWAPAAAGVALGGAGTLLLLRAQGREAAISGQTAGLRPPLGTAEASSYGSAVQSERTAGFVLVGAGAVALVAAGAMALFGDAPASLDTALAVDGRGAAVVVGGSF